MVPRHFRKIMHAMVCAVFILALSLPARSYGPLGHFRVVLDDWDLLMAPSLKVGSLENRQLLFAALAGSVASDTGYVMGSARQFTDAVHYVRPGDFVNAAIQRARSDKYQDDPRMLAFALGLATHYWADRFGHYHGTNVLVASETGQQFARLTYERDACTHTRVELRLGVADLRESPEILKSGFLETVKDMNSEDPILRKATIFVKEVVEEIYPGTAFVLSLDDLYRYLKFVAGVLCLSREVASEVFADMSSCAKCVACTEFFDSPRIAHSTGNSADVDKLIGYLGTPLSIEKTDPERTRLVYERSRQVIREQIREWQRSHSPTGLPPNVNLDTGLPSRGGQYQCADSAFQHAITNATAGPRRPGPSQALTSLLGSFKNYRENGRDTRKFFGAALHDGFRQPLSDAATKREINDSLFDLVDLALIAKSGTLGVRLQRLEQCATPVSLSFAIGDRHFQLDPVNSTLCIQGNIRRLEYVFGYATALEILQNTAEKGTIRFSSVAEILSRNERSYKEALERLRLSDVVGDQFLYRADTCADCQ